VTAAMTSVDRELKIRAAVPDSLFRAVDGVFRSGGHGRFFRHHTGHG